MQLKLHTVSLCFFYCGLLQVQSEERAFTRTFHMPWVCALWAIYTMNLQNDKSIGHAIQKIIICAKLRSNKATCIISGSRDSLHKVCTASDKILGCDLQLRLVVPCVAILFWKNINCSVSETLAKNFKAIRVTWNIPENVHQPWGFNKWVKIKCKEDSMSPTWQNYLCKKYAQLYVTLTKVHLSMLLGRSRLVTELTSSTLTAWRPTTGLGVPGYRKCQSKVWK